MSERLPRDEKLLDTALRPGLSPVKPSPPAIVLSFGHKTSVGGELVVRDLLELADDCGLERQLADGGLVDADAQRITPRDAREHEKRLQIIAVGAGVIVVDGPEIDGAGRDAVIGIGIRKTAVHRAVPRKTDRNDARYPG